MFENETYEVILQRMINAALAENPNIDSREGSLLWLGEAPAAVELQNLYIALQTILNETFADTASRDYLILRASERGITPYPATPAVLQLSITPTDLDLPIGTRFSIGSLNYAVTEAMTTTGNYEIQCETPGEAGNDYGSDVIPIEYVEGLETATVTALLIPGEDVEDTESLRNRYFKSIDAESFGGNVADYIEKVNSIQGVGGVRVYPVWNGGGTVKLTIINGTYSAPSQTLIDLVQTTIDPLENQGEGLGLAPIGHVVTVNGVEDDTVDVGFTLTYQSGYTWEDVQASVTVALNAYLLELAQSWADTDGVLVVRISQIESRILGITGILDISGTTINSEAENYVMAQDTIPVLGVITVG